MPSPDDRQRLGLFEMKCPQCGANFLTQVVGKVQGAFCQTCQQVSQVRSLGGIHMTMPGMGSMHADKLPGADPPSQEDDVDDEPE
jgi:hypothetical protein